jgi:hypothetical protein
MARSFLIFGLPRSRTTWLSRFLSYGQWSCGHDELRHMRSMADISAWFTQPNIGSVETIAAPFWRLLDGFCDDLRVAVVRRPVGEVVDSLMAIPGVVFDRDALHAAMTKLDRKLDQITVRMPGVLSVNYADLASEETCARLFEHCLGTPHDPDWWAFLHDKHIVTDMFAETKYCQAYRPALERLGLIAKHRSFAELAKRPPVNPDGITFQTEDFRTWLRDASDLFDRHLILVGEAPGDWQAKNLPLMETLDDIGAMQIMTARSNGRMFGYLMSLISPSLTSDKVTTATHTTFYADPQFPGLGMKIQRAAMAALKERGVTEIFMEAGKRASGPRIGSLFKRLGAVPHGEVYRLEMAA